MTDVTVHQSDRMGAFDAADAQLIQYLGLNPNDARSRAVVAVCRRYDFDPLLKHVIVIPKGGVYVTRDGLLNAAHRSGQFDGMVVEQDPTFDPETQEWVAKVTVYRKDMRHGFTYPGRYPASGGNKQYAPEMALKCAEAHALRRAFDITGLPTLDEQRPAEQSKATPTVSVASFQAQPEPAPASEPAPVADEPVDAEVDEPEPKPLTDRTRKRMFALFSERGIADDEQLPGINNLLGTAYTSRADLTEDDAARVIAHLEGAQA